MPEASSNFPKGYKIVSFYVDPEALLTRAYVLRTEGWRSEDDVYQRIISKKKIDSIRDYLLSQHRVFVNNIVVTLPDTTKVLDAKGNTISASKITTTSAAQISIPREFNSVGIVDGQHRVLSYHEGGRSESKIAVLRTKQNLLATGIVYPHGLSTSEKVKFKSRLFLEINSTQMGAKSDIKQAIGLILNPVSEISIAKRVVLEMNAHGPLEKRFERYSFEKDKIKTTSIVSYGVRNVIKFHGSDSLYTVWTNHNKSKIGKSYGVVDLYVSYCAGQINVLLSALKDNLPAERWTTSKNSR